MQFRKFILLALVIPFLMGVASSDSGYSNMPIKREALGSRDDLSTVHEDAVRPEEVYKNGVQEIAIIASDTGFLPSKVIVRKNIPVRVFLTSASPQALCFVMDDFSLKKGVEVQKSTEVRFLPTRAGQYRFYCPINDIKGTVVVRD